MPVAVAVDIQAVWARYKEDGDAEARMELIEHYAWLAKVGAGRVHVPPTVMFSQEDLYGNAVIGLIDAVEKFDPNRGRPFESYALLRIKGSIVDALRTTDWLPRGVRQNETRLREAMTRIEMTEGRSATDLELRTELGLSESQLDDLYAATSASAMQSLEQTLQEVGELNSSLSLADHDTDDPAKAAENSQVCRLLQDAIDDLPDNERTVVALYYYEDMTLKEIGKVLGVTESRACQLHTKAILKLQTKLARMLDVMFMAA